MDRSYEGRVLCATCGNAVATDLLLDCPEASTKTTARNNEAISAEMASLFIDGLALWRNVPRFCLLCQHLVGVVFQSLGFGQVAERFLDRWIPVRHGA